MKKPLSLEQIRAALRKQSEAEHKALSARTGVPFSTIRKFAYKTTASPRYATVIAIAKGLQA